MRQTPVRSLPDTTQRITLRILGTSDLHGHVGPGGYRGRADMAPGGLARLAPMIREARAETPNSLLFDNGDFLQGTPLSDLAARPGGWPGQHPVIAAMNAIGYDAVALGNHEFNFGLPFLSRALAEAQFPATCANIHAICTGTTAPAAPTLMLERQVTDTRGRAHRLRIGVIGLVPPQITRWDRIHLHSHLITAGITQTARRLVPGLRARGADIVIALAHTGIAPGADGPEQENAALPLGNVPGIDAMIAGHSHRVFPGPDHAGIPGADTQAGTLNGTPAVMPGFAGSHLGVLDLTLERGETGWHPTAHRAEARPVAPGPDPAPPPPDPAILRAIDGAHRHTLEQTGQRLASTRAALHTYLARIRDDAALRLVNDAQAAALAHAVRGTRDAGLPVLSATACFRTGGRSGPAHFTDIAPGPLKLGDLADLYPFPNTLAGARITGAQLRDWLERAASCFSQVVPGAPDQHLIDPNVPGHALDAISGVSYRIDLTRPPRHAPDGSLRDPTAGRILDLCHDGAPVTRADRFLIATNSYRAMGGGPYPGVPRSDLIALPDRQVTDILADHVAALGTLGAPVTPLWSFLPVENTRVLFETGPGLRDHPADIAAMGAEDLGLDGRGFLRLRLSLAQGAPLANPPDPAYVSA